MWLRELQISQQSNILLCMDTKRPKAILITRLVCARASPYAISHGAARGRPDHSFVANLINMNRPWCLYVLKAGAASGVIVSGLLHLKNWCWIRWCNDSVRGGSAALVHMSIQDLNQLKGVEVYLNSMPMAFSFCSFIFIIGRGRPKFHNFRKSTHLTIPSPFN